MGLIQAVINYKFISKKLLIISLAYFMGIVVLSIGTASNGLSNSLFDFVTNFRGSGSASVFTLTIGVLPILAIAFPLLMDSFERSMIVTRIEQKRMLFYHHFVFSIMISAFFTLLMVLSGIVGSYIATGQIHNLWGTKEGTIYFLLENKAYFPLYNSHVTSVKIWSYIIGTRFLAILFMSMSVIFLKLILKKNIYAFFVAIILFGTNIIDLGQFSLMIERVRITLDIWLSPAEQLINIVYFVLGIVVLSLICVKIYDRKEFYY